VEIYLNFTAIVPTQTNWIWAAVAATISRYYDPNSPWTQCAIANSAFNRVDCCNNPGLCNISSSLDAGLTATGNLAFAGGPVTKDSIAGELGAGNLVCVHISWPGGGGEIGIIFGYAEFAGPEDNHFFIYGPASGDVVDVWAFGFCEGYYGDYDATYFTAAAQP